MASTTPADLIEATKAFTNEQRYEMAMHLLTALGGWLGGKGRKGNKLKDPNAPKREVKADSYVSFVNKYVLPHLTTLSEKPGLADADVKQLKSAPCRTQVGSALWQSVKDADDRIAAFETITVKKVQEAYEEWKANPPPPKAKKDTDTDGEDEKPKTKKRNTKKKVEAPPAAPVMEAPVAAEDEEGEEEVEEVPVNLVEWKHDFGKGEQTYKRLDYEGRAYIYELETKKYLGVFVEKTNKLNTKVADPLAE
jgi:hypothetical protein